MSIQTYLIPSSVAVRLPAANGSKEFFKWMIAHVALHWAPGYTLMEKKYWEANARTPLPRREYTKRSDYDVMDRLNRHEIHAHGWTHEQDNLKIRLDDEKETVVAEEKGRNTYARVANAKCQAAADYWQENHSFWSAVRNEWKDYIKAENKKFTLNGKVEGKPLYVHFLDHPVDRVSEIVASFVQE